MLSIVTNIINVTNFFSFSTGTQETTNYFQQQQYDNAMLLQFADSIKI